MQTCENYQLLINLALDDMLEPSEQQVLAEHLKKCPECRLLQAHLIKIKESLDSLQDSTPDDLHENILRYVREHTETEKTCEKAGTVRTFPLKKWSRLAACAVACLILAFAAAKMIPNLNSFPDRNTQSAAMENVAVMRQESVSGVMQDSAVLPQEVPAENGAEDKALSDEYSGMLSQDLPPLFAESAEPHDKTAETSSSDWFLVCGKKDALPDVIDAGRICQLELEGETKDCVEIMGWELENWTDQLLPCGFTVERMERPENMKQSENIILVFEWL